MKRYELVAGINGLQTQVQGIDYTISLVAGEVFETNVPSVIAMLDENPNVTEAKTAKATDTTNDKDAV